MGWGRISQKEPNNKGMKTKLKRSPPTEILSPQRMKIRKRPCRDHTFLIPNLSPQGKETGFRHTITLTPVGKDLSPSEDALAPGLQLARTSCGIRGEGFDLRARAALDSPLPSLKVPAVRVTWQDVHTDAVGGEQGADVRGKDGAQQESPVMKDQGQGLIWSWFRIQGRRKEETEQDKSREGEPGGFKQWLCPWSKSWASVDLFPIS